MWTILPKLQLLRHFLQFLPTFSFAVSFWVGLKLILIASAHSRFMKSKLTNCNRAVWYLDQL